jgi:hypothetical protein
MYQLQQYQYCYKYKWLYALWTDLEQTSISLNKIMVFGVRMDTDSSHFILTSITFPDKTWSYTWILPRAWMFWLTDSQVI